MLKSIFSAGLLGLLGTTALPVRAERHLWSLAGTQDLADSRWDVRTGTIIAVRERDDAFEVVRIHPQLGIEEHLATLPRPGEEDEGDFRPMAGGLLLLPDGAIELVLSAGPGDSRLVRILADGKTCATPIRAERWLDVKTMVIGPGGNRYVVEVENRLVSVLAARSQASAEIQDEWFEPVAIAGRGLPTEGLDDLVDDVAGPVDIAVTPAGELLVADDADYRILKMIPRPSSGETTWACVILAGSGPAIDTGEGHADARNTALGSIASFRVAGNGQVYASCGRQFWEFTPYVDEQGVERWRSQSIAAPPAAEPKQPTPLEPSALPSLSVTTSVAFSIVDGVIQVPTADAAPPRRNPAPISQVATLPVLTDLIPGVGPLLADRAAGLYFIGPPPFASGRSSDADLADQVYQYKRLKAQGDGAGANVIMATLVKQRDCTPDGMFNAPFLGLSHPAKGDLLKRGLPEDARLIIGSFLVDPAVARFRAAMAIQVARDGASHPLAESKSEGKYLDF